MGINYEEPYCEGISFFGELPIELDPNAIEYLPLNMLDTFEEELPMKSIEPAFDDSVPTMFDENLGFLGLTVDDAQLLHGLWLPELNGYSFNNPTSLEISKDFSNINENPCNFPYNSLPYKSQYISSSQNFVEVPNISDDQIFLNSQSFSDYPAYYNPNGYQTEPHYNPNGDQTEPHYNPNGDQTEPYGSLGMYSVPLESSNFTNQNLWVPYNSGYKQNSQAFPDESAFYKEPAFFEMPHSIFFQNSPYQTCINGNFNSVNVPNNSVPNNFAPNNYIANNYVANSFVPNSFAPNNFVSNNSVPNNCTTNNYAPTNYDQVNNSQTCEIPAPMEKFTYKKPNNSGLTNMSSQVYPSYNGETQARHKITRNSPSKSSRKTFSSRMQSNKGYRAVPNNPNEQSIRLNNQYATEFHSNIKDITTRPQYVRVFSKCSEDYDHPSQLTTKFQDRPSLRKNREAFSGKSWEHNQSHHNSKSLKSHHYKQPSKYKDSDSLKVKGRQLKENVGFQRPNSSETSFLSKEQQDQAKLCDGLNSSKQPGSICL